jgi:hypothetical protein
MSFSQSIVMHSSQSRVYSAIEDTYADLPFRLPLDSMTNIPSREAKSGPQKSPGAMFGSCLAGPSTAGETGMADYLELLMNRF